MQRRLLLIRPAFPNLAELALHAELAERFTIRYAYAGSEPGLVGEELATLGSPSIVADRYISVCDVLPRQASRVVEYGLGLAAPVLSRLPELSEADVVDVVDPLYIHAHQAARRLNRSQRLVVWRFENIAFRYELSPLGRFSRLPLERADRMLCVTEAARQAALLEGGETEARSIVLRPGVRPVLAFPPPPRVRAGPVRIVTAARLTWSKGIEWLLDAVALLKRWQIPAVLDVAGTGLSPRALARRAERLAIGEIVRWHGAMPRSRLYELLQCADIYVQPSLVTPRWSEQLCFALVEAMSAGLPCVVSSTGVLQEVGGPDVIAVPAQNAHALATALADLIELGPNRRNALGRALHERARREFDPATQARRYLDALDRS